MKKICGVIILVICLFILGGCVRSGDSDEPSNTIGIQTFATASHNETTPPTSGNDFVYSTDPDEPSFIITTVPTTAEDEPVINTTSKQEYTITDHVAGMYSTDTLNVRSGPGTEYSRIGKFYKGDEVNVTGIVSNGWYRVDYKGTEGYVSSKYLTDEYEAETTVTEATTVTTTATSVTTTAEDDEDEVIVDVLEIPSVGVTYSTLNYKNQKAVWFAYLDIDTWLAGATESSFTSEVRTAFANVKSLGCNTVYVHTRAYGDAYYHSEIFPFAGSYTGTIGDEPSFDPLEIMIEEAHALGLSFHAWVNPMRTAKAERYGEISSDYMIKKWYNSSSTNGTYIVYDDETECYWLSPAYQSVRQLICDGIAEIILNYKVDGIHIDDYFYPTTDASFDKDAFKASGESDLAKWRMDTVSGLVADIYTTVKACNPEVLFGVSPQGNIKNNINKLYADVELWCSESGYLDYIVPQIYYGFDYVLPFDTALNDWNSIIKLPNIQLVCGIAAYKVGSNAEWSSGDMISRQTDMAMSMDKYTGCAYYRYSTMFPQNSGDIALMIPELNKLSNSISKF